MGIFTERLLSDIFTIQKDGGDKLPSLYWSQIVHVVLNVLQYLSIRCEDNLLIAGVLLHLVHALREDLHLILRQTVLIVAGDDPPGDSANDNSDFEEGAECFREVETLAHQCP